MKPEHTEGKEAEILALIATLHETGQRLEQLTDGQVDSVSDSEGRTFLLQSAQDRLRHTEMMNQAAVLNALPAHIALIDAQGIIVSVNEAWRDFGEANAAHGPGHGVGVDYLAVCDQARGEDATEASRAAAGIRAVLAGQEECISLEYPCHAPSEQRWFLMRASALSLDHARGAIVMHIDITDRKFVEMKVISARNRLQATFDAIPDPLFELGLDGRYYSFHSPRTDLLAAPPEQLIGRTIFEILPAGAANIISSALHEANDTGRSMGKQFDLELPQGRKSFELSITRNATSPGQAPRFTCISRDVTERKMAEDKLNERTLQLERFHRLSVGRELQMIELKKQANELAEIAGLEPSYNLEFMDQRPGRAVPGNDKSS